MLPDASLPLFLSVQPRPIRLAEHPTTRLPFFTLFTHRMRRLALASLLVGCAACAPESGPAATAEPSYLYVWAGDSAKTASDFLAVINSDPASPQYGTVVTVRPTGESGANPHHTEAEMPANGHLLANGFSAGRTYLFDLTVPTSPRLLTAFGDRAGFSHPHTFIRLANGNVLATFQYAADSNATAPTHNHDGAKPGLPATTPVVAHRTGGLVEMDERGTVVRARSASDPAIRDRFIYPYSVLELASTDRAISTTTDMDEKNTRSTAEWVQLWRLSDLTLLKSIALSPGPRGDEHHFTGEPYLLPDGKSVYIHTFNCGLYLVRNIESDTPTASFVKGFTGKGCGVPVLIGHFWIQPVPETFSVVSLDISDPERPREVSSINVGKDEYPHWLAKDPTNSRLVLNSGGSTGNRLFIVNFDKQTGTLAIDRRFRDPNDSLPGLKMSARRWPHGWTGTAVPHGTVFSR